MIIAIKSEILARAENPKFVQTEKNTYLGQLIFNVHDVALLATTFQCLLFAFLILLIKIERQNSDYLLILFLLVNAAIPLWQLIYYGEAGRYLTLNFYPGLFRLFEIALWLEGPIMIWYTKSLVRKDYRISIVDLLYILPAVFYGIYLGTTFYTLEEADMVRAFSQHQAGNAADFYYNSFHINNLLNVFFGVICLMVIHNCQKKTYDLYSNPDEVDLNWLKILVIAYLSISVWEGCKSIASLLNYYYDMNYDLDTMGLVRNYTKFLLVSMLIFFNLRLASTFKGLGNHVAQIEGSNKEKVIDPELVQRIERHMETKKPFLYNRLNLEHLANQLQITPRTLSSVVNRHFDKNFFEFINHYRIEEAKQQLEKPEMANKTIIDVMHDSGFNSKATFNTFFKKMSGNTPSQFRALHAKQSRGTK